MYGRKGSEDAPVNQNCLGGENMNVETAIVSRHRNIIEWYVNKSSFIRN